MNRRRRAARAVGLVIVAVWLPLLGAGIVSLRTRGRLGDSDVLITSGPYAYVRHPLYAGLSLTVVGVGLIVGSVSVVLAGLGWLLVTRIWSLHEERSLARRFGPEYAAYRNATPALVPDVARVLRLRSLAVPQHSRHYSGLSPNATGDGVPALEGGPHARFRQDDRGDRRR